MELIFIHGWGFDARFWDALGALLPEFKQSRVNLGFFGRPSAIPASGDAILIGHSLGFVHGMRQRQDWLGWIAINSFPRFVRTESQPGCVTAGQLREMKIFLGFSAERTLDGFYQRIGAQPPEGVPDIENLGDALDELHDADMGDALAALDVPGLVLASRKDPLVPAEVSESLGTSARKGGLSWHDAGGHMLPQHEPEWCAKAIKDFLAGMT